MCGQDTRHPIISHNGRVVYNSVMSADRDPKGMRWVAREFLAEMASLMARADWNEASGLVVQIFDPETDQSRFVGAFPKDQASAAAFAEQVVNDFTEDDDTPLRITIHLLYPPPEVGDSQLASPAATLPGRSLPARPLAPETDMVIRALHVLLSRMHLALAGKAPLSPADWDLIESIAAWYDCYQRLRGFDQFRDEH